MEEVVEFARKRRNSRRASSGERSISYYPNGKLIPGDLKADLRALSRGKQTLPETEFTRSSVTMLLENAKRPTSPRSSRTVGESLRGTARVWYTTWRLEDRVSLIDAGQKRETEIRSKNSSRVSRGLYGSLLMDSHGHGLGNDTRLLCNRKSSVSCVSFNGSSVAILF